MNTEAPPPPSTPDSHLVAFLAARSLPCPRCGYDLRDIQTPKCPECGEELFLTVGVATPRFGWLILAVAPGCFSGVAACFVLIPIVGVLLFRRLGTNAAGQFPLPVVFADMFGFLSAASVILMYKHRNRIMSWPARRQMLFAGIVWFVHAGAFGVFLLAMWVMT